MSATPQCEPWVSLNLPAIGEVNKALHCLSLEVDSVIVEDIRGRVERAFTALWRAAHSPPRQLRTCPECKGNGIVINMAGGQPYTYPTCHVCMGERVVWEPTDHA